MRVQSSLARVRDNDTPSDSAAKQRLPSLGDESLATIRLSLRVIWIAGSAAAVLILVLVIVASTVHVDFLLEVNGALEPVSIWTVRPTQGGIVSDVIARTGTTVHKNDALVMLDSAAATQTVLGLRAQVLADSLDARRAAMLLASSTAIREDAIQLANAHQIQANAALRDQIASHGLHTSNESFLRTYTPGRHVAFDVAVADVQAANAEYASAVAQSKQAAADAIDTLRRQADVARLKAELNGAVASVSRLALRAPHDGVVLTDQPEHLLGTLLRPGDPAIEIADVNGWHAVCFLSPEQMAHVRIGDVVQLQVPSLADRAGEHLRGRITEAGSEPDISQKVPAYRVIVRVDGAADTVLRDAAVRRGYPVNATIVTRSGTPLGLLWDRVRSAVHGAKLASASQSVS